MRRFQFSLRTLFVVVTLAAVACILIPLAICALNREEEPVTEFLLRVPLLCSQFLTTLLAAKLQDGILSAVRLSSRSPGFSRKIPPKGGTTNNRAVAVGSGLND